MATAILCPITFEDIEEFNLVIEHTDAPQQYDFGDLIELHGDVATVRWESGGVDEVPLADLQPAEEDIVSGRIDNGRCMFCGLCMEACPFESFFMTNEYDGMSGYSRQELWMDAPRTRVLPCMFPCVWCGFRRVCVCVCVCPSLAHT